MTSDDVPADVFAVPDFWKSSSWLAPSADEGVTSFFSGDPTKLDSRLKLEPVIADDRGFFRLPRLGPEDAESKTPGDAPGTEETLDSDVTSDDADSILDPWILDEPRERQLEYKTWDTFNVPDAPKPQVLHITEAGPAVYDALLGGQYDLLRLNEVEHPVVDTKTYLSALMAVAVGRESVLFKFDAASKTFKPTLPKMRISGHSTKVLQGIQGLSVDCGSTTRRLRRLMESTYVKHVSTVRVALASALDAVLGVIESSVALEHQHAHSLLQLQSKIRSISSTLSQLHNLVKGLRPGDADEAIIALVFRQAVAAEYKDIYVRDTMREVLRRVAHPWLDFMEEWIGTRPESGVPLTKEDVGRGKCFIKIEPEMYTDDFGEDIQEVDFRLDRKAVPDFIPDEIADALFETGRNLRFIRSSHPEHPLAFQENILASNPPTVNWLYDWDSILQLERRASDYQADLASTLLRVREKNKTSEGTEYEVSRPDSGRYQLQLFGADPSQIEQRILSSIKDLDRPLPDHQAEDRLKQIIRMRLSSDHDTPEATTFEFTPHWSLLPSLSFGPIVSAHGRIVNRETLRLLFSAHGLRTHIDLQRQFQLFGNGMFCSRLSHALFDPDMETAERQAGVARQGGVMGLRLSGRDNWPPASSELRLALMGILAESYGGQDAEQGRAGGDILPGDMSFAVRDMAPEDVDKLLDQDTLEALDFLRLSYKPPAALAPIMTPAILVQYDRVFKLMLRVLRLIYVVGQLYQDITSRRSRWYSPGNDAVRFCFEARSLVNGVSSYFVDVGISMPWTAFNRWLDRVQEGVEKESLEQSAGMLYSPERVRMCHSLTLDQITHALLLRKRQQPVLKLLEEIFACILQFAKRTRSTFTGGTSGESGPELDVRDLYRTFRKKVEVFITVCRGLTEKGDLGMGKEAREMMDDLRDAAGRPAAEEASISYLLMKLDMFSYYVKGTL